MQGQFNLFDYISDELTVTKPIRLIEFFGGIGAQASALERLGANFEHWRLVEFDKYPVKSYNAIHGTNFEPADIRNVHGVDLGIEDVERFTYLLTYSFPCVDLSVAGKGKGMSKDSGTRSGLLWEVERILKELYDDGKDLPQILLMENVPQVHGKKNMDDFNQWLDFLTSIGYTNRYQDLNAKNYGIAQNRNRCFCVSILGDAGYSFPEPIELRTTMKDYLDDEVDDKYYITSEKAKMLIDKLILGDCIDKSSVMGVDLTFTQGKTVEVANAITARYDAGICKHKYEGSGVVEVDKIIENIEKYGNPKADYTPHDGAVSYPLHSQDFVRTGMMDVSPTLAARDYKDPKVVYEVKKCTKNDKKLE